jgi:hypothetical protein
VKKLVAQRFESIGAFEHGVLAQVKQQSVSAYAPAVVARAGDALAAERAPISAKQPKDA